MVGLTLSMRPVALTLELRALGSSHLPPLQVSCAAHRSHQLGFIKPLVPPEGLFLNRQILRKRQKGLKSCLSPLTLSMQNSV